MTARLALAVTAIVVRAEPVGAQQPTGVSARGTLTAAVTFSGTNLPVGGTIALYRRGASYRLDLLSIGIPGADATLSALATPFLMPGGITLLFDARSNTYTVLSMATKRYFSGSRSLQGPRTGGAAVPTAVGDPFAGFGTIIHTLGAYQSFSLTTTLLERATVNAHPATRVDINLQEQRIGGTPETVHVQLALADDLDGFPVQIVASRVTSGSGEVTGSATLDLTSVDRVPPPPSTFVVPAGFTRVDSLASVLRPG